MQPGQGSALQPRCSRAVKHCVGDARQDDEMEAIMYWSEQQLECSEAERSDVIDHRPPSGRQRQMVPEHRRSAQYQQCADGEQ